VLVGVVLAASTWACGPFFPDWLLSNSDQSARVAPVASFFREIAAWKKNGKSLFKTAPPKEAQSQASQVSEVETRELAEALQKTGTNSEQAKELLARHKLLRDHLQRYADTLSEWRADSLDWRMHHQEPKPKFTIWPVPDGLPTEFADYLRGATAYYAGETNAATAAWDQLLQRPPTERRYRSVWAEYMLGRMLVESDPKKAVQHFQNARSLAKAGFADSTGLAAASLGWEARAWINQKDYNKAVALYGDQISAGDKYFAVVSLKRTIQAAFAESASAVEGLAGDAQCRRVVTAALISQNRKSLAMFDPKAGNPTEYWLRLLEKRNALEVELAEQLALAAYQEGNFEIAERWLNRAAKNSAVAHWLRAKLFLRMGKVEEAAQELSTLARRFPPNKESEEADLLDRLEVGEVEDVVVPVSGRQQLSGELGVVQLQRKDFVASLDCLIRGGFWMDAAYVAERVLTTDELKRYVDKNWPKPPMTKKSDDHSDDLSSTNQIRSLLARRLVRENRPVEALPYFREEEALLNRERFRWLEIGNDPKRSRRERANALWEAAKITRKNGLELIGSEVEPDWAIHGGAFEAGVTVEQRSQQKTNAVLKTTTEELGRAYRNRVVPERRFHYRYLAADLGWRASELMPDQSAETARVLCEAGGWLKDRDPKEANRFYRSLVLRCSKTELGIKAAKLHWFPPLEVQTDHRN
jgi:tetratricopeptide (TPR) repeat protein